MKNTRRFISAAMAFAMVSALAPMGAFAADGDLTTVDQNSTTKSGTMTATYDVTAKYTVTIPAGVALKSDASVSKDITASDVMLESGQKIKVTLTQASNTASGSSFNAKNDKEDSTATYTIGKGEATTGISVGDVVAEFIENGTQALTFSKAEGATHAGTHTETLTFGISVEEAVTTPTLAHAFENGSTTAVTFKDYYNDYNDTTITFTKNNDQYSYSSSRNDPTVRSFTQSGDKIIIICGQSDDSYGAFTITLDKSDNSYSVSDPDDYFEVRDLQSVVVNGVDIKDTLSKK